MKKKGSVIFVVLLFFLIFISYSLGLDEPDLEGSGNEGSTKFDADAAAQKIESELTNPQDGFSTTIPDNGPFPEVNGVKYGPGEITIQNGIVSGTITPKDATTSIQAKGAKLVDGKISEAEEIITSQGTFKNVKGVTEENGVVKVQEADNIEKPFPETQEQQPITQTTETQQPSVQNQQPITQTTETQQPSIQNQQPSIQNQQTIQQDPSQIPAQILQTQAEGAC